MERDWVGHVISFDLHMWIWIHVHPRQQTNKRTNKQELSHHPMASAQEGNNNKNRVQQSHSIALKSWRGFARLLSATILDAGRDVLSTLCAVRFWRSDSGPGCPYFLYLSWSASKRTQELRAQESTPDVSGFSCVLGLTKSYFNVGCQFTNNDMKTSY